MVALPLGLLLGFLGSVPLAGPVAVLVFRSGLRGGFRNGLFIALGSSLVEGGYAFGAYWGMGALLSLHPLVRPIAGGTAAAILVALGLAFAFKRYRDPSDEQQAERKRGSFILGLTITLLNPTFIATWATAMAVLHGFHLLPEGRWQALPFALGVSAGIVGWFWLMLELLRRSRHKLGPRLLRGLQRGVGVFLVVLGLLLGWHQLAG